MFVIRIDDAGEADFKAYVTKASATTDFNNANREVFEGAYQGVALYYVPETDDPKVAIEAVKGARDGIHLVDIWESEAVTMDRTIQKILPNVKFDL